MLTSIGKQSGESVMKKKRKGCDGKDLQTRKVLSLEWKSEGWRNTNNSVLRSLLAVLLEMPLAA